MAAVRPKPYPDEHASAAGRDAGARRVGVLCSALLSCAVACGGAGAAFADDDGAIERGRTVFERHCAACHGDGDGDQSDGKAALPGTLALGLKYQGAVPALLEQRKDLDADSIRSFVRNGVASMPPFRPTEVSDEDIEAIAAFLARERR